MAFPSVTYTFVNTTTADATQVNQNFTDLINGLSDTTKALSIAALTTAGNTTLGATSANDLVINAALAGTILVKTTNTYDLGSSTVALRSLYLADGGSAARTTRLIGATVASSYTYTLPPAVPAAAGYALVGDAASGTYWMAQRNEIVNGGLTAAITTNTLVITLTQADGSTAPSTGAGAVYIPMRNATATSTAANYSAVTATSTITLGTADSIGVTASSAQVIYVYWIKDTTSEIGLSATLFDDGEVKSATALTGGAETDATLLYANSAHTSMPIRLIGRVVATWSNPNWGSLTDVSFMPFSGGMMSFSVTATAGAAPSGSTGGGAGTNGTGTWVCPKGIKRVLAIGRGGGGGGGGGSNLANAASGGGGGGTASVCNVVNVVPGTSYTLTAGAGGAGANGVNGTGGDGSDGTDTTFGALLSFVGGHRGIGGGNRDQSLVSNFVWYGAGSGGGHGGTGKTSTSAPQAGGQSPYAQGGGAAGANDGGGGGGGDGAGGTGGQGNATSPGSPGNTGANGGGGGGGGYSSGASAGGGAGAGGAGQITVVWVV